MAQRDGTADLQLPEGPCTPAQRNCSSSGPCSGGPQVRLSASVP